MTEPSPVTDKVLRGAAVLIVDDQEANIRLLEGTLREAGYTNVRSTMDPREVAVLFDEHPPDLVLLDLHMPHMDGFQVMEQLRPHVADGSYLPIVMLTADDAFEAKKRALSVGAKDFLSKPFDLTEVILRIRNLLETRFLHKQLRGQNEVLEAKVLERTRELEEARLETLERLALAAEFRDDATFQHTRRVGTMSARLAAALGLPPEEVEVIRRAAPLHDVGKIGIPDDLLLKPGALSRDEFDHMKSHTWMGATILSGSRFPILQRAEEIARTHHERWDGRGYVEGLKGESIPAAGRIVSVADTFDALTHERPYKTAWPIDQALAEIERQRERQFDPDAVDAFVRLIEGDDVILIEESDRT
jgi:putative two-component system response regulator